MNKIEIAKEKFGKLIEEQLARVERMKQDKDFISHIYGIDVILGGHSHTYFTEPAYVNDKKGHQVLVDHEGKNACFVGLIEMEVE